MSRKESPEKFQDPGRSESIGIDRNVKQIIANYMCVLIRRYKKAYVSLNLKEQGKISYLRKKKNLTLRRCSTASLTPT